MSDEPEKTEEAAPAAAETEASEKPKPARKPRAAKPKADAAAGAKTKADAAAGAKTKADEPGGEEKPKRTRAAKPKADEAEAAKAPKAEKVAEKPTAAAKPKAAPKRGAAKREERPVSAQVVRAQAKYVRSSARKARLVCDNIRGKSVTDARAILAHTPRAVARDWSKLLESAIANAENNHDLDGEDLVIKAVHADEGPTIKRFRPRAMGRATQIRKRTAHLTILLTPKN
jgi:ribosomal protein L22